MKKITYIVILFCLLVSSSCSAFTINNNVDNLAINDSDLEEFILNEMEYRHIPGLSASIVIDDEIIWKGAYGYADIENDIPVTNETLFKIASISKTLTATCLMQLWEQDLFELDDPINDYLPYDVIHPQHPSVDITFRMLLTHTSSIVDNWNLPLYYVGDAPISFQDFLREYLVSDGGYYRPEKNFGSWEPGTSFSYSNLAVALVGYLVEVISEVNFLDYTQTYLFEPLDMYESGWYLRELNVENIAMPYNWDGDEFEPYGHIGYVDVPAGDLRTSSSQLANFLSLFIQKGIFNGNRIIESDTVDLMLTPDSSSSRAIGLIWWRTRLDDRYVWGHGGSDFGCRANMQFDPETNIGVVVLVNTGAGITQITKKLFEYAESILDNLPPEKPSNIQGPNRGGVDVEHEYKATGVDPENSLIYYWFDWGDSTNSGWLGPYESGEECSATHSWNEKDTYHIKVKVKDDQDKESEWSDPFSVSMPRVRLNRFLYRIINRFLIQ